MPRRCSIIRATFLLLTLSLALLAKAESPKPINWLMVDWPPYMYQDQDGSWQGYGSAFLRSIQANMSQYKHSHTPTKFALINDILRTREQTCAIGLFPSEARNEIAYFSLPDQVFPPMQIWFRADTYRSLGYPKIVKLGDIVKHKSIVLGLKKGVAYAKVLRDVLNENQNSTNILRLDQKAMTEPLLQMLLSNRIDAMLEYSDMLQWISENNTHLGKEKYQGVQIEEVAGKMLTTRVACSKSKTGANVIEQIDDALPKLYLDQGYWSEFFRYITKEQQAEVKVYAENMAKNLHFFRYTP